jgi:hypothetical protein
MQFLRRANDEHSNAPRWACPEQLSKSPGHVPTIQLVVQPSSQRLAVKKASAACKLHGIRVDEQPRARVSILHIFREVCASSQSGPDATSVSRLEELLGRRHQAEQAARSLLGLQDPDSPFVKSELKRLNAEMKSLGDSIRTRVLELLVESVTVSKHSVDIHFRANGIEQIVDELTPMSERIDG